MYYSDYPDMDEKQPLVLNGNSTSNLSFFKALVRDPKEELQAIDTSGEPPEDKYQLVYLIHVLLGIGLLLPWNAYITADDYYELLWPGQSFEFWLSIAYNYPGILMLVWNLKWGRSFPFGARIFIGFVALSFFIFFVPIITTVFGMNPSKSESTVSEAMTLVAVLFSGGFAAMLFGTTMGMASLFPPQHVGAVMAGNGVAGLLVGLLRIITKLAFPNTTVGIRDSSIVYFALAAFVLVFCAFGFSLLIKNPFGAYYLSVFHKAQQTSELSAHDDFDDQFHSVKQVSYMAIFKKIWLEVAEVFYIFFVTLTIFPGFILNIPSQNPSFQTWFGILLIFDFQVFDFVGRMTPKWMILFRRETLWIPIVLRTGLVVLFVLCISPRVITIDGFPYLFMAIFAFSNGYCSTLATMFAPTRVEEHEKEAAGAIIAFALNLGIFFAVQFAVLFVYLVAGPSSLPHI